MTGKVLVLDDDRIILNSCERVLSSEGMDVAAVSFAKEALAMLQKEDFDLVITDIVMPEMDGIEFIRQARQIRPNLQVIVITGHPSQDTLREALSLKIIDYIPKPFTPSLIIEVVQKALEIKKKGIEVKPAVDADIESAKNKIDQVINKYRKKRGCLIPILQEAQEIVGYLPPSVLRYVAKRLHLSVSEVHGVVSFYSFFSMKPKGKHNIKVCLGTACYVKGSEEIINKYKTSLGLEMGGITEDRLYSLESVRCLGACGLAPVVVIDKDTHGSVTPVSALELLKQYN
jgi:NADH:ubiquinone oxidoreductase subunit E